MRKWKNVLYGLMAAAPVALFATGKAGAASTGAIVGPAGHYYELVPGTATWAQSNTAAKNAGGYLVTINSTSEQNFVEHLLTIDNAPGGAYWMGAHKTSAGDFRWSKDGDAITYSHWLPSQPDNFGSAENSGSILWSTSGQSTFSRRGFWNDLPDGGYPKGQPGVTVDLVRSGYIVEFLGKPKGTASSSSSKSAGAPGSSDATSAAAGGAQAVPLPAAVLAFPFAAALAGYSARRLGRKA